MLSWYALTCTILLILLSLSYKSELKACCTQILQGLILFAISSSNLITQQRLETSCVDMPNCEQATVEATPNQISLFYISLYLMGLGFASMTHVVSGGGSIQGPITKVQLYHSLHGINKCWHVNCHKFNLICAKWRALGVGFLELSSCGYSWLSPVFGNYSENPTVYSREEPPFYYWQCDFCGCTELESDRALQ